MAQDLNDALVVRIEASLRKFEKQMEQARKAAVNGAQGAENAWRRGGKQVAANANQAATGLQRLTNISGRGRFVLQNTANQIGDIAVQMGSGTNASRALGQQLPQLLGGFGALGGALGLVGPLLGTVAALGLPVAAAFLAMGDEGRKLEDVLKDMDTALGDMDATAKVGMMTMDELRRTYGENAAAVRELYLELVAVNQQQALNAVQEAMLSAGNELSDLETKLRDFADARRELLRAQDANADGFAEFLPSEIAALEENVNEALARLKEEFGLTSAQAYEIVEALNALKTAKGPEEAAEAVRQISLALSNAAKEGAELDGVFANIAQTAATAYAAFSRVMTIGRKAAAELAEVTTEATTDLPGVYGPDGGVVLPPAKKEEDKPKRKRPGGGASISDEMREAQRIFEATRTELEKYNSEVARLKELHESGAISTETFNRAMADAKEKYNDAATAAFDFSAINDGLASGLADIIFEGEALSDVLGNLAKSLASAALEAAALSAFNSLFSAILPGFSPSGTVTANAHGNVFTNGRVTPFASGGVVNSPTYFPMRGGTGLLGEAGPEAILPLQRLPGGDLGVRSVAGNVSVPVSVSVVNNAGAQVDVRQSPDGRNLEIMIDQKIASAMAGPRGQKVMRDTYGVRPSVRGA